MHKGFPMAKAEDFIKDITNISVCIHERKKGLESPPTWYSGFHWHNYYTIDIVIEGDGHHLLNGKDYLVSRGDIIFTKPTDIHDITEENFLKSLTLRFTDDVIKDSYKELLKLSKSSYRLTEEELSLGKSYFNSIMEANKRLKEEENLVDKDVVLYSFNLLLTFILKRIKETPKTEANRDKKEESELLEYINVHFREPLTEENVAKIVDLSKAYFSTWFKKNVGVSFVEYITSLRIRYAQTMLKNGYSVVDSCYTSGFGSLSHFNKSFKMKTGKTPFEYKKMWKK